MIARLAPAALALALAASLLAGCATDPEPVAPTPAFASEEEAFAAAEATYRAYVDALNNVDLSDPATFEDVYAWTTGEANASARQTFSQMHAEGWVVSGATRLTLVTVHAATLTDHSSNIELDVCVDVSNVTVVDAAGSSVVDSTRSDLQAMRIHLETPESHPAAFLVESVDGRDGAPAC